MTKQIHSLVMPIVALSLSGPVLSETSANLIHDAEQTILQEQFGEKWAVQDEKLQAKLDALYEKYGKRPNIVHIMWDDTSFGEVGVPVFNKIRGFDTPRLNKMGQDGITFTRMYTEPSCTPTRAAALTGRLAVRSGMHTVSFPPEGAGLPGEEVTIAEVLSEAGYNTAFLQKHIRVISKKVICIIKVLMKLNTLYITNSPQLCGTRKAKMRMALLVIYLICMRKNT